MSEHDQTRSNQNNLEETGKQIGNLIADDMDMDPENEMEVDPAEEVTVSGEKPSQTHKPPHPCTSEYVLTAVFLKLVQC